MAKRSAPRTKLSENRLRLDVEGHVTLTRATEILSIWGDLLREVGREVSGLSRDAVRFVIAKAQAGSFSVQVRAESGTAKLSPSALPKVAKAVTHGLAALHRGPRRPKYFSDYALEKAKELAEQVGDDIPALRVANGTDAEVSLSKRMVANIDELIGPHLESIGSVEGELEGLIIHGRRRFLIFEALSGRQVTCYFGDRIPWEEIIRAFGQRVSATGYVRARRTGEKLSIQVSRLRVFPPEEELPPPERLLGILGGRE